MTTQFAFALREDLVNEKQFLPTRGEPLATGWDVRAAFSDRQSLTLRPFEVAKIPLGFRGYCPVGWWYELKPRSSSFAKKNLHALYGTIDESYEGELVFACQFIPNMEYLIANKGGMASIDWHNYLTQTRLTIDFGDAIGQIVPVERQEIEIVEWSNDVYAATVAARAANRGAGGFGSTGK